MKKIMYPSIPLFGIEHGKQVRITEIDGTTYISASDFAIRAGILVNSVRNYYRKLPETAKRMIRIDDPRTSKPLLMLTVDELKYFAGLIKTSEAKPLFNEVVRRVANIKKMEEI